MSPDATPVTFLAERRERPGVEQSLHVHLRADESFLVLEGTVALQAAGRTTTVGTGEAGWVPAATPHAVHAVGGEARLLVGHVPARVRGTVVLPPEAWPMMDGLGTFLLGAALAPVPGPSASGVDDSR